MAINSSKSCELIEFLKLDLPILDVRSLAEFEKSHIINSGHIPLEELPERFFELPKSSQPIGLVVNNEIKSNAIELLSAKNYEVRKLLVWEAMPDKFDSFESGSKTKQLWEPTPALEFFTDQISSGIYPLKSKKPRVLDIGCGSGRDLVYMANHGWETCGIDYIPAALNKYKQLSSRNGVPARALEMDLEKDPQSFVELNEQFELIQVFRYLHRPLLGLLEPKILPGGYLIYQTFVEGCEVFGKPKRPRFILKYGELASHFSSFEILVDKKVILDDGRPTNLFIARKHQ